MSESSTHGEPYQPFPSFDAFAAGGVELGPYVSTAEIFSGLKSTVPPEALQQAVDTATRWAAVDTGAIEGLYSVDRGFTMSVAASAAALDNAHLRVGEDVARAIKDAVAGYEFVLDVTTGDREASEQWVKELHSTLCASQETYRVLTDNGAEERPLEKGAYKIYPNSPVNLKTGLTHAYAPPMDTQSEMARLVDELRSEGFGAAHPVQQAAYAHYAFVCIHPFPDGNGRVARALASTYLYRRPGVPLVVFADQKGDYIDALEAADAGDFRLLLEFVRERAIDTMMMVTTTVQRPTRPSPAERIAHLNTIMRSDSGLMHTEIDALLSRVTTAWAHALDRATDALSEPLSALRQNGGGAVSEAGYRGVQDLGRMNLVVRSSPPASGETKKVYSFGIARPGVSEADFAIFVEQSAHSNLASKLADIFLREVHPTVSPALTYRLDALAEDAVSEMVELVVEQGEQSMRNSGYIS